MKTRDAIGIFWDGEEVDGALFYGLWAGERRPSPSFPLGLWPPTTEVRSRRLWGDGWTVWMWELRIRVWPTANEWQTVVNRSLEEVVSSGAGVSWCAVEGCFVDPPALFDPDAMSEGVWACRSRGGIAVSAPPLQEEFTYVPSNVLADLRAEAMGFLQKVG